MQDSRVQIMHVNLVLYDVETQLVAFPQRDAAFNAAAGQPHRESIGMMVAAVVSALAHGRPAEFAAPDHQG